jgi:hypothetical protein
VYKLINLHIPNAIREELIQEFLSIQDLTYENYINHPWIYNNIICRHSTVLANKYGFHSTSSAHNKYSNIPHSDPRPAGLNLAIANCTDDSRTVFFSCRADSTVVNVRGEDNSVRAIYYVGQSEIIGSAALLNNGCMLLNTTIPHTVINLLPPDKKRIVLSIDCKVSYDEAVNYFDSLGLVKE